MDLKKTLSALTLAAGMTTVAWDASAITLIEQPVSVIFDIGTITIVNNLTRTINTVDCSPDIRVKQRAQALANAGNNQAELAASDAEATTVADETIGDVKRILTPICGVFVTDTGN
ncbi:MAG TPA: hypothetical protein VLJ37_07360 [bacterium]|nr:hypothetical protein [bacterium]